MTRCLHPECGHSEDVHTRGDGCTLQIPVGIAVFDHGEQIDTIHTTKTRPCPCGAFQRDRGADRDTRPMLCTKVARCILLLDHAGSCAIIKPRDIPTSPLDKGKIK